MGRPLGLLRRMRDSVLTGPVPTVGFYLRRVRLDKISTELRISHADATRLLSSA